MVPADRRGRVVVLDPNANTPPYDRAVCRALARAGWRVELATAPFLYEALPSPAGYRLDHAFFRIAGGPLSGRLRLAERPAARRLLKAAELPVDALLLLADLIRRRPDVLHVQWAVRPALEARLWPWLRRRGIRVVYTAHNLVPHAARADDADQYGRLYHAADAVIVHSRRGAAALAERFGVSPEKIAVAPHGPLMEDVPELGRGPSRRRLGLPEAAPLILFAGLIEPYKGLDDLIDAFGLLSSTWPAARLVVAGRPNEPFDRYRRALLARGLLDRTHLDLRFLPTAELAQYLCAADVVVLPYRETTTSGLLMAAWRFGRPVVSTAVGDLGELIADGRNGLLVPPSRPAALAAALERLLADPALAARLGAAGRRHVRDHGWDEAARRTVEVYWSVVGWLPPVPPREGGAMATRLSDSLRQPEQPSPRGRGDFLPGRGVATLTISAVRRGVRRMPSPVVSVVVVNWNGWHFLPTCLGALEGQAYCDFEVVLVDNGSVDGSVENVRRRYPWVRLIENPTNVGFAVANNQALASCRGRYLALLNNDTRADPGWLGALVGALETNPRAAGACGTVVGLDDPSRVVSTLLKVDPSSGRAVWVNQPSPAARVDQLSGSSMLIRRSAIDRLGFFDPAYVAYFEETDWCARALRAGYELLYVPEAVVAHKERGSTSAEFHAYQMARNQLRFALKNFDVGALPRFLLRYPPELVVTVARNVRDGHPGRNLIVARALLWNLGHLPATLAARRRDLARVGPNPRSYNRSLPLRDRSSDRRGGLRSAR